MYRLKPLATLALLLASLACRAQTIAIQAGALIKASASFFFL
jgi:hypothetical protein